MRFRAPAAPAPAPEREEPAVPPEIGAPDPLAPFRAPGAKRQAVQRPTGYRAFAATPDGVRPARLDIRPKTGMAVARLYGGISEIAYDRGDYTGILLIVPGKLIKVRGRGLKPVVEALLAGTCEYLAELKDGEQAEEGAPLIDRIEVLAPQATPS